MSAIELRQVSKVFSGGVPALVDVNLVVRPAERLAVLGPSGSGKSTLLRILAGLESPTAGEVWIGGHPGVELAPRARDVAMVFQNPTAYPHLSVFENLAFGLRARRFHRDEIRQRVTETAEALGLTSLLNRKPSALSGGQRQRVAIGRAIARRPALLLLDEPFSSLDAPLRASLRAQLIELQGTIGFTMIHVTHDQAEAMALGDRVAVVDRGRIIQVGSPLEIYDRPANLAVARFLGAPPMNLLPCALEPTSKGVRLRISGTHGEPITEVDAGTPWLAPLSNRGPGPFELGLRPENARIVSEAGSVDPSRPTVPAELHRIEPLGHETLAFLTIGPHPFAVRCPPLQPLKIRQRHWLQLDLNRAAWFDPVQGHRIDGTA